MQQAIEFYELVARQDRIKIDNRIEGKNVLNVSFDVVYFALANLIGNSLEKRSEGTCQTRPIVPEKNVTAGISEESGLKRK